MAEVVESEPGCIISFVVVTIVHQSERFDKGWKLIFIRL